MKKLNILILFIFCSTFGFSQIYVANNSSIFVKNTVLFAKDKIDLNTASSNLYLRNEAQFVQGTTSTSTNTGLGSISLFQEGTSDNFEYNYWSSPVGLSSATPGNGNFDLGMFYRPTDVTTSVQAATTTSNNGISSPLTIAKGWVWTFRTGTNFSNWFQISDMAASNPSALKAGEGFTMKGTAGSDNVNPGEATINYAAVAGPPATVQQRYDFRGKPNDGNINISVLTSTASVQNITLTGNPYPSAINLNFFLLENSGRAVNYSSGAVSALVEANKVIEGIAYFWEQSKVTNFHFLASYVGGYGSYVANGVNALQPGTYTAAVFKTYNPDGTVNNANAGTGNVIKRMYSPVGQGFMVIGATKITAPTAVTAVMKNIYRVFQKEGVLTESQFERSSTTAQMSSPVNWDDIPNVAGIDYTQFSRLPIPQIKIHSIFNNLFTKEITIAFNPNTTDGYDTAMEAITFDDLPSDINFDINNNITDKFVTTTLPFALDKRIKITLKAEPNSVFNIKVKNYINFNSADAVFLYDNVTGLYHDINNSAYEFSLPEGTYSNRFEITFQNTTLLTPTNTQSKFVIVQNNNSQTLSISNPNLLDVKSINVYDISGKLLLNKSSLSASSTYEYPTSTLSDGVYIVNLITKDNESVSQKIIVKGSN